MPCKSTDIETTRFIPTQINQVHFDSTSSELIFTGSKVVRGNKARRLSFTLLTDAKLAKRHIVAIELNMFIEHMCVSSIFECVACPYLSKISGQVVLRDVSVEQLTPSKSQHHQVKEIRRASHPCKSSDRDHGSSIRKLISLLAFFSHWTRDSRGDGV